MAVAVMQIGIVGMAVCHGRMTMPVGVRLQRRGILRV